MRELTMNEIQEVSGGMVLLSSWMGHLGRAFAFGYVIGSAANALGNVGNSSGASPFQYGA